MVFQYLELDVEYILTIVDDGYTVTMLDFGMFENLDVTVAEYISEKQEYNLYYHPSSEAIPIENRQSCKDAYIKGITEALTCFDDGTYALLYNALMHYYIMHLWRYI